MNIGIDSVFFITVALQACTFAGTEGAHQPAWTGQGSYRIVVEVPPVQDLGRAEDEMVASVELDLHGQFPDAVDFD